MERPLPTASSPWRGCKALLSFLQPSDVRVCRLFQTSNSSSAGVLPPPPLLFRLLLATFYSDVVSALHVHVYVRAFASFVLALCQRSFLLPRLAHFVRIQIQIFSIEF